ncbi:MAG TPA: hydroxymethylbilane synthase [Sphingomonadaceae bacterium]|nr:hydroxymethylbilane synthase [Sphingomonadaceae bacterium]
MHQPLRLGSRGSPLALTQARMAGAALCAAHGWAEDAVTIVPVVTSGDRIQDRALAEIGGKALWTKELDIALAAGEIDASVHSMKDVETIRPAEVTIAAMLPRADVRDRLIGAARMADLPEGARVGTSSPRRAAQLRRARPDLRILLLRGNVATRLARLASGDFEATLLAAAGLGRLGHDDIGTPVPVETMLPAPAQGAIGIETLTANHAVRALLAAIDHAPTSTCVRAERALLAAIDGTCRSPIAALAVRENGRLRLRAELIAEDGREWVADDVMLEGDGLADAAALGHGLLARASPALRALFAP